jgi:hypothetical protein
LLDAAVVAPEDLRLRGLAHVDQRHDALVALEHGGDLAVHLHASGAGGLGDLHRADRREAALRRGSGRGGDVAAVRAGRNGDRRNERDAGEEGAQELHAEGDSPPPGASLRATLRSRMDA